MPPKIGIILPAYNATKFLAATLDSVRAQTFDDWEAVIVDDGSRDGTLALAEEYAARDPRIRAISQKNAGPSTARNTGYAAIDPAIPYIVFLDSDDLWEPDALEHLLTVLERHPDALAAYGLARGIDGSDAWFEEGLWEGHQRHRFGVENGRVIVWPEDRPTTFAVEAVMERIITSGTVLLRRRALELGGLWAPDLSMSEDWELWLRICRHGDMVFTDTPVLRYRRHGNNLSADSRVAAAGELEIRRRLFASLRDDPSALRIARTGYRFFQSLMLRSALRDGVKAALKGRVGETGPAFARAAAHGRAYLRDFLLLPPS